MATDLVADLAETLHHHGVTVPHHEHETLASYAKHIVDTLADYDGKSGYTASVVHLSTGDLRREARAPQNLFQTQTVSLSRNGAGTMADDPKGKKPAKDDTGADDAGEDDLFDDSDVAGDGEGDGGEGGDDFGGGMGGDSNSATIAQVSQELEEMGLMVDPSKDADEFLEHLATAIKTHKATKSLGDGGAGTDDQTGGDMAGNNGAGAGAGATPEQNQYTMMSRRLAGQDKRVLELETELSKNRMAEVLLDIDLATKAGLMEQTEADGYKAKLQAKQLSLTRPGDVEIQTIVTVAKRLGIAARKQLAASGLLDSRLDMSRAIAVGRPAGQFGGDGKVLSDKESDEAADEIMGKKR